MKKDKTVEPPKYMVFFKGKDADVITQAFKEFVKVVTFEQLGVDRLFVDESHNYKNLFLYTKSVNEKGDEVADMPARQSNLGKTVTDDKLSDRPAEWTSLQERLAAMKARVSGTPAGRDAVDKAKGKDQIL